MVKFANKLKRVKKKLQAWNKQIFGRVDQKVRGAEDRVFDDDPSEVNKIKLRKAKMDLDTMLQIEEQY